MENKKWASSQEQNLVVIVCVKEFFIEKLSELEKEAGCTDSLIYYFIVNIQNEWDLEFLYSIVRKKRRKIIYF